MSRSTDEMRVTRQTIYAVTLSAILQVQQQQPPMLCASALALGMSISAIGVLRQPPRWRPSFSRFAPKQSDKAAVLRATPQSAHPPPPPQYHHHQYRTRHRQDEPSTSIRSAISTMRAGAGGHVEDVRYSQFLKLVGEDRSRG